MTSDIGKLRSDAAKLLGLEIVAHLDDVPLIRGKHYATMRPFNPTESHYDAALLLAEVERRGKQVRFGRALASLLGVDEREHFAMLVFAIANATPLQKTRAAIEAMEVPTPTE